MKDFRYDNYEKIARINLGDILFYCLKRIKLFGVVLALVGIILALFVIKAKKNETSVSTQMSSEGKIRGDISPTQTDYEYMEVTYQYQRMYEKNQDYYNNSIIHSLDVSDVVEGRLRYYVDSLDSDVVYQAVSSLSSVVMDGTVIETIHNSVYPEYDKDCVYDILSVSDSKDTDIIDYVIYSKKEEDCDEIMTIIEKRIEEIIRDFQKKDDSSVKISLLSKSVKRGYSQGALSKQSAYVSNINSIYTQYGGKRDYLRSHSLISFYDSVYAVKAKEGIIITMDNCSDYYEINVAAPKTFTKKDLLVVILLWPIISIVAWFVIGTIMFLADGRIKNSEEIQYIFGEMVLANVKKEQNSKWKQLVLSLDKRRKCMIDESLLVKQLKSFEADKVTVCHGIDLLSDEYAKANSDKKIILAYEVENSKYTDIAHDFNICKKMDIDIVGVVCYA